MVGLNRLVALAPHLREHGTAPLVNALDVWRHAREPHHDQRICEALLLVPSSLEIDDQGRGWRP